MLYNKPSTKLKCIFHTKQYDEEKREDEVLIRGSHSSKGEYTIGSWALHFFLRHGCLVLDCV